MVRRHQWTVIQILLLSATFILRRRKTVVAIFEKNFTRFSSNSPTAQTKLAHRLLWIINLRSQVIMINQRSVQMSDRVSLPYLLENNSSNLSEYYCPNQLRESTEQECRSNATLMIIIRGARLTRSQSWTQTLDERPSQTPSGHQASRSRISTICQISTPYDI